MTPDQIEAQRKKFENKHPVPKGITWERSCSDYATHDQFAALRRYSGMWLGWLSAIESNEIELPSYCSDAEEYISRLKDCLFEQGFKVKV